MKKKRTLVGVALLVAVLMLGVGYAAISNITLNINGNISASPSDDNFIVKLVKDPAPVVSDADLVSATVTGDKVGTINVTGLTAKGEFVTATYTVANTSPDLKAGITASAVWSNKTYFNVTTTVKDAEIAALTGTTTVEVKVELIKTPVDVDVTDTVTVSIVAAPVQQ